MRLFGATQRLEPPKMYWARYWDERLYKALFASTTETNLTIGHYFGCLLDRRSSKVDTRDLMVPTHTYGGIFKLWLSESEFCDIPLSVAFDDNGNYDHQYSQGSFCFSWVAPEGRTRASMIVTVRNQGDAADHVARLFAETKAGGGKGLNITWSAILKDMIGRPPDQVWGDWNENIQYDDEGRRITPLPVGRRAFALQTVSFEAEL